MAGPPAQQHQNFQQQQPGPNPQNFINNGPRFQNFQRMTTHPPNMGQQQGATNTASGGGGGGPPPGQMRPIMQNVILL